MQSYLSCRHFDGPVILTRGQSDLVVSCELDESESADNKARFGLEDGRFCFAVVTHSDPAMSLRACTSVPTEFTLVRVYSTFSLC